MKFKKKWKLYEMINKIEKGRFKYIRFLMSWSERKTKRGLNKLKKDGVIKEENGIYYTTSYQEMINWEGINKK